MEALGIDERSHRVLLMLVGAVLVLFHLLLIARTRRIVAGLIVGRDSADQPTSKLRRVLAGNWHLILGGYFVAAWASSIVRVVVGNADPIGPGAGMVFVLMATLALYCVAVVVLDWFFYRRAGARAAQSPEPPAAPEIEIDDGRDEAPEPGFIGRVQTFEDLAKQFVHIALICFVAGGLLSVWGVDLTDADSPLVRLWDVALIAVLGYVAFQSARILIERRMAAEVGSKIPSPARRARPAEHRAWRRCCRYFATSC